MSHILQHILEEFEQPAAPPAVKLENGHAGDGAGDAAGVGADEADDDDAPLHAARLAAAIVAVLLEHGRLRCVMLRSTSCILEKAAESPGLVADSWPPPATSPSILAKRTGTLISRQTRQRGEPRPALRRPSQAVAGAVARLQVAQAEVSGRLHAAFRDLVRERCLERCKPCDLPRVMPRVGRRLCYKTAALLLKIFRKHRTARGANTASTPHPMMPPRLRASALESRVL